jgi:dTDP-4-amino-4,6-dideoxygalactose transaminase
MNDARRHIADRYNAAFEKISTLDTPSVESGRDSSWHLYILRLKKERLRIDRNQFVDELRERGIGTSVHFIPLNLHPFYQKAYGYRRGDCPVAEEEFERCFSLPIYPGMSDLAVEQVIDAVSEICKAAKRQR